MPTDWSEFTENGYQEVVRAAAQRYSFVSYPEIAGADSLPQEVALWRHDVDFSVHRAVRLAQIEADYGIQATYFFMLRGAFYNLLESEVGNLARQIAEMGHWIGLHFDDAASHIFSSGSLDDRIRAECSAMELLVGLPVDSIAFHNPSVQGLPSRAGMVSGLANAQSESIDAGFEYVSDSNGYWRFRSLLDAIADPAVSRLHVLIHPGWWPPEPLAPRRRIERCVEGRARAVMRDYDRLLDQHGSRTCDEALVPVTNEAGRGSTRGTSQLILTFDVDWAPDFAIDHVRLLLEEREVRATWFITHQSPAIDRLRERPDLFEIGLHPNFLSGSSHGANPSEVLRHCMSLAPDACSIRPHALHWSSHLLDEAVGLTNCYIDASVFLPAAKESNPVIYERPDRSVIRIPFVWEDDYELERPGEQRVAVDALTEQRGTRVINIHPIHIYLNTASLERDYGELKRNLRGPLQDASKDEVEPFRHAGIGIGSLFLEVIDHVSRQGHSLTLKHLADEFVNSKAASTPGS